MHYGQQYYQSPNILHAIVVWIVIYTVTPFDTAGAIQQQEPYKATFQLHQANLYKQGCIKDVQRANLQHPK